MVETVAARDDSQTEVHSSPAFLLRDYLSFRIMVSPLLIKLAYVFGAVALLVVGIDSLGAYITAPHGAFRTCNDLRHVPFSQC
jgi:hypothetical protein